VADAIEFSCRAISAIEPPRGVGWIVTNPPYGVRLQSDGDMSQLYGQFGKVITRKCPGWKVVLLSTDVELWRNTGLRFDRGLPLRNGGLKVRLIKTMVSQRKQHSNVAI
jgi:23S rRNA G2445 N2-methylase RlmL